MKSMKVGVLLTAIALVSGVAAAEAQQRGWVDASNGYLPPNAVQGGHEGNGQPLYICRASYGGGVHIGKFRADWRGCNIPFGGKEITLDRYQVMVR
jgi:hypothetical protein